MQPNRFRTLLDRDGPFVSVHFDSSHDTEGAAAQLELRWRAIRDELEAQGVGRRRRSALQTALRHAPTQPIRLHRKLPR
ncbi:hypothetical protein [[Mycobacterium] burgundiense]|uniref:Uncharacterized protein n=1 Tax=[Mycobacterium] burgundiense TaxID=3064286 RepID=A0ABN9NSB0_9MYCO|nr:hypothetical protein [Mycolicibacterium sp. MU0053]CAJ1511093.1 hypothetical protein MU0053_005010 [Mycolicibacterium sp. MU0053]